MLQCIALVLMIMSYPVMYCMMYVWLYLCLYKVYARMYLFSLSSSNELYNNILVHTKRQSLQTTPTDTTIYWKSILPRSTCCSLIIITL